MCVCVCVFSRITDEKVKLRMIIYSQFEKREAKIRSEVLGGVVTMRGVGEETDSYRSLVGVSRKGHHMRQPAI